MKLKLVVSDFHLGKGRVLRDGSQNILEDFIYDREFAEFLAYYSTGEYVNAEVELILNGDILNLLQMDSWGVNTHLITERAVVRSLKQIIEGHPEFFAGLRSFAATPNHSISYIVGNHDVGMLWTEPRKVFSQAVGADVKFHDVYYEFDGVYVEHGQQYETFSATDMKKPFFQAGLPEPVLNLPWGSLFVTTLLTQIKQSRPHVDKVRPIQNFIRWVVVHDFWWGLATFFRVMWFILETMINRGRYRLYDSAWTMIKTLKDISIYPSYDKIAFKILEQREHVNTVIFGHTHILRYRQWRKGKEYVNEGSWNEVTSLDLAEYGTHTRMTYAAIEYPAATTASADLRPKVRIREWKGFWKPEKEILV
jgi:UDP-2,3-diacylglucosamine pyrophosphatase LpxH